MQRLRYIKGFTLIELVVTIVIISILAVASVPLLTHVLNQNKVKAAAEGFVQYARLSHSAANERQQDVYLVVQTGSNWCYGINTGNGSCTCGASNTCNLGSSKVANYPGVSISITGFTGGSIYFDSIRALPSEASTITFQKGNESIQVSISRLGNIALCGTNVSGYPTC